MPKINEVNGVCLSGGYFPDAQGLFEFLAQKHAQTRNGLPIWFLPIWVKALLSNVWLCSEPAKSLMPLFSVSSCQTA